jgi:capsular polysaccharide biosynthesis protein
MLGMGVAILLELLDRRVRTPSDLEQEQNAPLLAVLSALPTRKPLLSRLTGTRRAALPNLG